MEARKNLLMNFSLSEVYKLEAFVHTIHEYALNKRSEGNAMWKIVIYKEE